MIKILDEVINGLIGVDQELRKTHQNLTLEGIKEVKSRLLVVGTLIDTIKMFLKQYNTKD